MWAITRLHLSHAISFRTFCSSVVWGRGTVTWSSSCFLTCRVTPSKRRPSPPLTIDCIWHIIYSSIILQYCWNKSHFCIYINFIQIHLLISYCTWTVSDSTLFREGLFYPAISISIWLESRIQSTIRSTIFGEGVITHPHPRSCSFSTGFRAWTPISPSSPTSIN